LPTAAPGHPPPLPARAAGVLMVGGLLLIVIVIAKLINALLT
jgi:hypothetical protein